MYCQVLVELHLRRKMQSELRMAGCFVVGRRETSMMHFEKIQLHKAGAVSATEEDAYWQIGFADDAQNPTTYLLV